MKTDLDSTRVNMLFQKSGDNDEHRRVIIQVSNFQVGQYYDNLPYNRELGYARQNTYGKSDVSTKRAYSDAAKSVYEGLTGEEAPDGNYTLETYVDEQHENNSIYGHLSYDENGILMITPLTFSKDAMNISTVENWDMYGVAPKQVLDLTDKLSIQEHCDPFTAAVLEDVLNKG